MRVAITGSGVVSSLGNSIDEVFSRLIKGETGVKQMPEWRQFNGLKSHLGAPAHPYNVSSIPRVARRTMSRMSEMALVATVNAMTQANVSFDGSNRYSLILGSTSGSPEALESFYRKYFERNGPEGQFGTTFFKFMNHSVASNVAAGLNYLGPQIGISSACSTSSHAIILGWELLQSGLYDFVIAGGADELHHTTPAVFDIVEAASRNFNETPDQSPRPFDSQRDGLVVSEGASVLILETELSAKRRGATVAGWLEGGAYLCDGTHMSQPQQASMLATMRLALERAAVTSGEIGYINAHATGTRLGDVEEVRAIGELFGNTVPVSSLKGHLGHSLAACGGMEAMLTLEMMNRGVLIPTRNLERPDPLCHAVNLLQQAEERHVAHALSNNFAFGGMNTALILSIT